TQFSEAKARGESVREHEKGVPFLYYNWNKYVNRNHPDDVIPKETYAELSEQDKQQYKGVKNREIRVLFNIDQTLLPMANETAYTTALKKDGTMENRGYGDKEDKQLHGRVSGFLQKMKHNLVNVRQDGTGVAHYDTEKDVIYLPRQRDFEHYNDYVQEMMRQLVSATGHQQRLAREGMVMKNGKAPSEDAVKKERLIMEIASGVKMLELGLPARLSKDSLGMVDYWTRELKEDPCLIDAIESEVNGALKVLKKAEQGEKVEYATDQHQRETAQIQGQLPNHYFVADEIKQHPNEEQRTVVIVRDDANKTADVVLPQGASLEVNNEIKGMNKQRFTNALQKEGYDNVRFYNPDGALGFRPDDSYFADKKITVSRLRNWSIEDLSSLDATEAVTHSRDIGFDNVQLVKDDKERWALYIKPEGKEGFAVYPDKGDLNHFFTTLKQSMDNIERVREELAQKYYAMAEAKPDLKVDIFGGNEQEVDLNRIQRVAVFRAKSGECLCAATIDGKKLQPRSVSPSQWQRLWVAPERDSYKQNLAASLFADVLQKDNNVEQSTQEKQEEATEVKQAETVTVEKHDEQKEMAQQEDKPSDQKEQASEQREEKKEEKKEEKAVKAAISPLVQQYLDLKKKHPDAILLFRCGDFYETYKDDAVKASNILGITLTKSNGRKDDEGKPLAMAGFPYHALDTYLPKLIRAGERVAICDQLEMPKQTTSSKRGIAEMVTPGQETGKQMAQESQETGQHTSLRR
ncbi:MAG: zincin-like metallopeptidase domain-containing protein, partial [Prevotella sp.]|nr:zincin-like metallopeptidase domain-containing protein [Prevotella sp.]